MQARNEDGDRQVPAPQHKINSSVVCYACEAEVPEGRRHCPACGCSQLRMCYCGNEISVTLPRCPHCSADWSQSARVRRRKSRSRRSRLTQAMLYAATGAVLALLLTLLGSVVLERLAAASLEPGASLPAGVGARLALALSTVAAALGAAWSLLWEHLPALLGLVMVVAFGAAMGLLVYMARARARYRGGKSHSASNRAPTHMRRRRA